MPRWSSPSSRASSSGRVSGLTRTQDGFYHRLADPEGNPSQFGADVSRENGNDMGREAGRVALLWTPAKTVSVPVLRRPHARTAGADRVPGGGAPPRPPTSSCISGSSAHRAGCGRMRAMSPPSHGHVRDLARLQQFRHLGHGADNRLEGSAVAVKSITAYRELDVQTKGDGDATPYNIVATGGVDISQHQFSEEVQFSGTGFRQAELGWRLLVFHETARDIQRSRQLAGLYILAAMPFQRSPRAASLRSASVRRPTASVGARECERSRDRASVANRSATDRERKLCRIPAGDVRVHGRGA